MYMMLYVLFSQQVGRKHYVTSFMSVTAYFGASNSLEEGALQTWCCLMSPAVQTSALLHQHLAVLCSGADMS